MKYRQFGRLNWKVSALGFGCMRLPTKGTHEEIDEEEAARLIYYAIEHGVNYIDTAYGYHGGNSERFLGRALQGGWRERIRLATKLPSWLCKEYDDFDRLLDEQLSKLQTDHIDFYLLHGLGKQRWEQLRDLGVRQWFDKPLSDGRIRHVGFSFHDSTAVLKQILDEYDGWDFCQIQYNYMNEHVQAGTEGLQYAASKGLGVVVMEPLLGGKLVNPPPEVQAIWDAAPIKRTPAEWALRWLWNKPEVSVVLSGMSTMEQVQENVASADRSGVGIMTEEELAVIAQVRNKYEEICPIPCTDCKYCMPCPNGVNIPRNFAIFNQGVMFAKLDESRRAYERWLPEPERASACIQCRECEEKCPQSIPISEWMPYVHEVLGEGADYDPSVCARLRP